MQIGIVIPIYNEEALLPTLVSRLDAVLDALPDVSATVTFVDDGSRDGSVAFMRGLSERNPRYRVIVFSRNFGHQPAITAGLDHAPRGCDAVVVMDGDLQDPPELIPAMIEKWRGGAGVVRAVRRTRAERGLRGLGFRFFYMLLRYLTDLPAEGNAGVFGLLDREAVEALRSLPERNRFLPGLRSWVGFTQAVVEFDRPDRDEGESRQSFWNLTKYALDAFFSFSYKPLRLMTFSGLLVSGCGFLLASVFVFKRLFGYEVADTGFTTLVTLILFLGGLQLISLGILGEYIARIYDEAKARPMYVTRARIDPNEPARTQTQNPRKA